jgi:DNA polymerase III sliding clamp (beta) subunit (PCNA family)
VAYPFTLDNLVTSGAITKAQAKFIACATAPEDIRTELVTANLNPSGELVASDGYRLHIVQCNPLFMPVLTQDVSVITNPKKFGENYCNVGKYPDYSVIKPDLSGAVSIELYADELQRGLKLCGVIARDNANSMSITLHDNGAVLRARSSERGDIEHIIFRQGFSLDTRLTLDESDLGQELVKFGVNNRYMLDLLQGANVKATKKQASDVVKLYAHSPNRPIVFKNLVTSDYAVVMPMQVTK